MSEQNNNSENTEPSPPPVPKEKVDKNRYKSDADIIREAELKKERDTYLTDNNNLRASALKKRGISIPEGVFEGMDPNQVNKFLTNMESKNPETTSPNTPIIGTPVGSGESKTRLDTYLTVDLKARSFEMDVPSSVLFGKANNAEEAKDKWLEAR